MKFKSIKIVFPLNPYHDSRSIIAYQIMKTLVTILVILISGGLFFSTLSCRNEPSTDPVGRPREMMKKDYIEDAFGMEMKMLWIPGGSFEMGSPTVEKNREPDETLHSVTLDGFWIGETEVTQEQYEAVMVENPSRYSDTPRNPVEKVSWHEAASFCEKLKEETDRNYTLPTEAQWEFACRAGKEKTWSFGDERQTADQYMWHQSNADFHPHPVAGKMPNPWGIHDIHGNVWEWCLDSYDEDFYESVEAIKRNPVNEKKTGEKVLRGGSWRNHPGFARSASRFKNAPAVRDCSIGFRVARLPEEPY